MRAGQSVDYTDSHGKRHVATIVSVVGASASGRKTLDLAFDGQTASAVAHEGDQDDGAAYWQPIAPGQPVESVSPSAPPRRIRPTGRKR